MLCSRYMAVGPVLVRSLSCWRAARQLLIGDSRDDDLASNPSHGRLVGAPDAPENRPESSARKDRRREGRRLHATLLLKVAEFRIGPMTDALIDIDSEIERTTATPTPPHLCRW